MNPVMNLRKPLPSLDTRLYERVMNQPKAPRRERCAHGWAQRCGLLTGHGWSYARAQLE